MADTSTTAPVAASTTGTPVAAPSTANQSGSWDMKTGNFVPTESSTNSSPLITTSGASRSNYANNVNTLNTATSNLKPSGGDPSIVNFLNNNKMPSDYNSRAAMAKQNGIQNYTGSADQNTQLLGILQGGKGTTTPATDTTTITPPPVGGTTTPPAGADGTSTTNNTSTGPYTTDANGNLTRTDGGTMDPNLVSQYKDTLTSMDQQINDAKSTLASVAATMNNDPAALAAINQITAQFDQQMEIMKNKNSMVLGRASTAIAAYGGLGQMSNDFMSVEQNNALDRMNTIKNNELSAVLKAAAAYKKGDVAAFDAASKQLDSLTKEKSDALNKLMTEANNNTKTLQAQQKIDQSQSKQNFTDMNNYAKSSAAGITSATKGMNAADKAAFINSFVSQTVKSMNLSGAEANTFLGMINGQTQTASQTADKTAASLANTASNITSRKQKDQIAADKASNGGTGTGSVKFDKPTTIALESTGLTGNDIKVISQALYIKSAQEIIDSPLINDATKTVLEGLYGLTRTASSTSVK